jgi:2-polyprenyl-3-methyl-5-hydroxy-6-metoxy-1,4-benzoquinol methylase
LESPVSPVLQVALNESNPDGHHAGSFDPDDSDFYDQEYFLSMEYRYFSNAHRSRVRNLLAFLGVVDGKRILELGGGGGFFAHQLAERGASVHLVDYSRSAVRFARSRFPELEVSEVSAYDIGRLGREYDLVTCFDVIEHLESPARMLSAVRQVLAPQGRFYLSTDNESSPFQTSRLLALLAQASSHLSVEGRDFNMIKRVEAYRRHALRIDYHRSHVSSLGFDEALALLEGTGWEILRYRTYHLYSDPLKSLLTRALGSRSGTHMAFECRAGQRREATTTIE